MLPELSKFLYEMPPPVAGFVRRNNNWRLEVDARKDSIDQKFFQATLPSKERTPLDLATLHKQQQVADLLRKHGGKTGEELKAVGN